MAGPKYAAGKLAIAECDICGQRYRLSELKKLTIKLQQTSIKACPECWNPDHPQLKLGMYPVYDPQALREPRPDTSYQQSGNNAEGSRVIQWGWNPVGGGRLNDAGLTPNYLVLNIQIGTVTVVTA